MHIIQANYLGSFPSAASCPESSLPEYAFVGRSNVGKSSLINMLCHRKELARISNQPGKTQTINLYEVDASWMLADLPGYGYAKVSRKTREGWVGMIKNYLLNRMNLVCVFVLLDFRLPLQEIDRNFIRSLGEHGVPFVIVYTKTDKVPPKMHLTHRDKIESELLKEWETLPEIFMSSAEKQTGRDDLLDYIGKLNRQVGSTL